MSRHRPPKHVKTCMLSTYGGEVGGLHPTGRLSCLEYFDKFLTNTLAIFTMELNFITQSRQEVTTLCLVYNCTLS